MCWIFLFKLYSRSVQCSPDCLTTSQIILRPWQSMASYFWGWQGWFSDWKAAGLFPSTANLEQETSLSESVICTVIWIEFLLDCKELHWYTPQYLFKMDDTRLVSNCGLGRLAQRWLIYLIFQNITLNSVSLVISCTSLNPFNISEAEIKAKSPFCDLEVYHKTKRIHYHYKLCFLARKKVLQITLFPL